MAYSARHYAQALYELASSQTKSEQEQSVRVLMARLRAEGRLGIAEEIVERVKTLDLQAKQRDTVRVASAEPLSPAQQELIQKQFPGSNHVFTTDESLIAGIVVQKHNSVWYANLAKAAQQLRANIVR